MGILKNFKRTEVFLSNDAKKYRQVLQALDENNIRCRSKRVQMGSQNRMIRNNIGRAGENFNLQIMYYIYVKKADKSKARKIIDDLAE